MSPIGEQRVSKVFNILQMRPSGRSHGFSWRAFRESETLTLMARTSRMLGVQFPFGYRGSCRKHERSCVLLKFWHFLAWERISVGFFFLRHLDTEENRTRNFPNVFYATVSVVRWNIKWTRRNFQAKTNANGNHTSVQLSPEYPALFSLWPALSS